MLKAYYKKGVVEAGIDEAGRGCYAGPVFAAAVILPPNYKNNLLNDSKKLTALQRNQLRIAVEAEALSYCVASVDHEEIDRINILQATYKAMHLAIDGLKITPECLLIDGNRFKPYNTMKHICLIKGDGTYLSIAAASILAKTYRDEYMIRLHQIYPAYGWEKNKGYGTQHHREAIAQHGLCNYHRKSFQIIKPQQELF